MTASSRLRATDPARATRLAVVLVDPLPVVRAGLAMLIDARPGLDVVAEAGTAEEALAAMAKVRGSRTVVLVGLGLEGPNDAFWLIRTLRDHHPTLSVLACGARTDAMSISRALFVGADGFVDKNVKPLEFLSALQRAADGELVLAGPPSELIGAIADGLQHQAEARTRLTEREREVLNVAAEGLTAREIAHRLGVRERTVTTHLGRIYEKLGVGTRVAAVRVAASSGLVAVGAPE